MGKHSRCVLGINDNDRWYPEQHKSHSNVDGDIIMHKLPKEGAVRAAWINTILKGRKQIIQERKSLYFCNGIPAWLIN